VARRVGGVAPTIRSREERDEAMAVTKDDVEGMIATARTRARGNWRAPGSTLHVLIAGDERPLTTGALTMYLEFYSWLWRRDTPEAARQRVRTRLEQVPVGAEWELRDRVREVCVLWEQIQERSAEDQEAIRSFLAGAVPSGSYPELEAPPENGTDLTLEEVRTRSARQHAAAMNLLRNWPGLPG
jgi:hypothetical protein